MKSEMVYFRYYYDLEENLTGLGVHLEVELWVASGFVDL